MLEELYQIDTNILYFFNKNLSNHILDDLLRLYTIDFWHTIPAFVIIIPILVLILDKKEGKKLFSLFTISYILSIILSRILKYTIQRLRPLITENFINKLVIEKGYSFPSEHTLFAFLIATILSYKYPKYAPIWFILAIIMGIARVYEGVHYPSDVICGGLIGIIIGYLTIHNKNRIYKLFKLI
ncbi:phosphatase PAP2 family protein [Methanobrevibacter wolinii]|uniref:phosphatase PAP2 family protein n=1 Tax=Methanobrevibacter wolinii TaxID=190977 RepID=UPI000694C224|nr:phosphatase PAP2 family protein [Methanobrevibacter wolinii]